MNILPCLSLDHNHHYHQIQDDPHLCSVQIRANAPKVTAPDSPETIFGSEPSGLRVFQTSTLVEIKS